MQGKRNFRTHLGYSFTLSLGIHLLLLLLFSQVIIAIEEIKKSRSEKLKVNQDKHIYVELMNSVDREEEVDTIRTSLKNILETGKLSEKKGVHIIGNESKYLTITSFVYSPLSKDRNEKTSSQEKSKSSKSIKVKEVPELIESIIQKAKSGGYITENSLEEKFNVNKGDSSELKLGSKQIDAYPFTYNIIRKFKKNLTLYLKYHDGFLNPETVMADLIITHDGVVRFNGFIRSSKKQPKMNYLIRSSIESILKLSSKEMHEYPKDYKSVSLPIYLSFSGPPLNVFYFGIGNW